MTQPTWIGTSRIVNGAVVTQVRRVPVVVVEREIPITVCVAGDQRLTVEAG